MPVQQTLLLAAGLGMDAMSVCMAVGVRWHGPRQKFRLAWHMGLFQFFMPLLGWLAGRELAGLLQSIGTYLASGLVCAVGGKMLYEALKSRPGVLAEEAERLVEKELRLRRRDPTRGWSLVALSLATSLDALVAGVSLGLRRADIWRASVVIGLLAGLMALTGVILGQRVGRALGRYAEAVGAAVLIALGVSFLWL